jgi:hypothetical protein
LPLVLKHRSKSDKRLLSSAIHLKNLKKSAANIAVKTAAVRIYTQKGREAAAFLVSGESFRFFEFDFTFDFSFSGELAAE